jgi:molybdate transport system substrate-binding protein
MSRVRRISSLTSWALLTLLGTMGASAWAAPATIAVAANFADPARLLAARFEAATGDRLMLVFGSTGKLYAQIRHHAPFDAFLAADVERPRRLEAEGGAIAGTRFTYAVGTLVLWSPREALVDASAAALKRGDYRFLAIANPDLAPYGAAARQVLERLGLWLSVQPRLVRGESIGQAFQFVFTRNAELGFVALSQVSHPERKASGSRWVIPPDWHAPIEQQAVRLTDHPSAVQFLEFLRSEPARSLIVDYGYRLE